MHLPGMLEARASSIGNKPAIIFKDQPVTYSQLLARAQRFAHALHGLGVRPDDKVAIMLNNCPEFIVTYFACAYIGAVAVPVNIFYKERELEYLLRDSDSVALVANPAFAEHYSKIENKPPLFKHLVVNGAYREGLDFSKLEADAPSSPFKALCREDSIVEILYTSGTTGEPKGTMLTHANLFFHADVIVNLLKLGDKDRALMVVPAFHGFGITVILCSLVTGSSFVLLDPFNPVEIFEQIEKHKVTFLPMVVAMYFMLINHPERGKYDLSSLRIGISGASAMPAQLMKDSSSALNIKILEAWGLTECSASATMQRSDLTYKEGSVGLAYPGVKVGVMDEQGKLLGAGEVGELVIQGPLVMKGYYKKPQETAEALRGGWLHTGDMGYYDKDGYFFMVDRKKELINVGGEKVFPREVEELMYKHPAVADAVLIPQKDEKLGEIPVAIVVPRAGATLSEKDMQDFLSDKMARFKVPRHVYILQQVPRSPVGKILKKELVKMLEAGTLNPPSS
ncbi:MAG: long-chain-fatty-acid--CoA ligase [Dehalococcoidia bacterium]